MAVEISVIVPFLNEEEYIRRCLESLFAADYPPDRVEFIFVDNGSTDRGPAIVREYPRVRLLTVTDGKVYTARNAGLEATAGDVIAFTDADCAVARGWLAAIREETLERGASFVMGAVGFAPAAVGWIDHLELVSARTLYRKLFDYGEFEMHLPHPRYDPTYTRQKSGAEAYILQKSHFSIPRRLLFDFAVHSIATCFALGKWRARMRRALRGVATRRR